MSRKIDLEVSEKQWEFMNATEDEILYGGAAGGGKSYGQILDSFVDALKYKGIRQLILRRKFPELERSIIRKALEIYPKDLYKYNSQKHTMTFTNGSIIDFGYLATDADVNQYQSIEYDIIRFDELTHFTEYQYTYMRSRCRGANSFPKQIKSSTNPGNVGHAFVRRLFIDPAPPNTTITETLEEGGVITRRFIPAKVTDNKWLMRDDPGYLRMLNSLPEKEKKMLRDGNWDVFVGQFFTMFNRETHVCDPFSIPDHWQRYRAFDYGLDMLACYWAAFDELGNCYLYNELYEPGLMIDDAARRILECTECESDIVCTFAPIDMWARNRVTGKYQADMFAESGVPLTPVRNSREAGWQNVLKWLKPVPDPTGGISPKLHIFSNCLNLIRCLPLLQYDEKNSNDVAKEPHEITHAPDALRYLFDGQPRPTEIPAQKDEYDPIDFDEQVGNLFEYGL